MALDADPLRTLGLPPGASQAEIKAAYRRLAKAFHPDTAGEAAVPRFLAIQAAYEVLTGLRPSGTGRAPSRGGGRTEGWRADPDRARATREAWRARGARPPGGGRPAGAGGRTAAGGTASGGAARPGADPGRGRGDGEGADRRGGPARNESRGPAGTARDSARGRSSRPRSRSDRAPDRATPGSTTYDFADQDPFDPEWSGASWYGTTSGTYWTINPKEYADPRKHGPEYQARARRRGARGDEGETAAEAGEDTAAATRDRFTRPRAADDSPPDAPPPEARGGHNRAAAETRASADTRAAAATGAASGRSGAPTGRRLRATAGSRAPRTTPAPRAGAAQPAHPRPPFQLDRAANVPAAEVLRALPVRGALPLRVALALIGWPPIGFALAALLGELSGCSRFAAGCGSETFGLATWTAQILVIGSLLAFPRLAAISAVGTVAVLAASLPATMLLSATGSPDVRAASVTALLSVLAVAYVGGVAFAVARRSRTIGP